MTPPPVQVLEHTSAPAATGAPGPCRPGRTPGWSPGGWPPRGWLPRGDRARAAVAVIRREWVTGAFAVSAAFAIVTALTSANAPERVWGTFAAASYTVCAVTAAVVRRRGAGIAVLIGLAGAVAAPLAWMAVTGLAQPEVAVIIRSAAMLVHRGTPYASPAALAAAHSWRAYDPYLPALIVFGVPRVFAGGLFSDPRIWFGAVFVATFGAAVRVARVPRPVWWTLLVTASPVVALPIAVGGDDLPVLGLMCLGLALVSRGPASQWRWAAAAGLALGLAAAMKATAWPAVAVVTVLLIARGGRRGARSGSRGASGSSRAASGGPRGRGGPRVPRRDWHAVIWFAAAVLGVALAIDGPVVVAHPAAALANTVLYPLGLAQAASPAASLLPGHLLASTGAWGHWTALVLMALAGAGVGAWVIVRPPMDAQGAGWRLALGMALLFVLAPASRVGYFVYPLGLAAWLLLSRWRELPGDLSIDPEPQHGRLAVQGHH